MRKVLGVACLGAVLGACVGPRDPARGAGGPWVSPEYRELAARLAPRIERMRRDHDLPGLSLALVDGGQTVWSRGFGWADPRDEVPARGDTVYRAGSLAKLLTALAVLRLSEEGRVDIHQPVVRYLPGFSMLSRYRPGPARITVAQLLSHHGGLPTDLLKGMWSREPFTAVTAALGDEHAAFPPGRVYSYSNLGYTVLGHLVQQVSGQPFERYVTDVLIRPLGMEHTAFSAAPRLRDRLAQGHRDGLPGKPLPIRDTPAFALYSSARDLARLMALFLDTGPVEGAPLLDPDSLVGMLRVQHNNAPLDLKRRTGLCWSLERDTIIGAGLVARHGGVMPYYSAELVILPEHGLGVAVLANSGGRRAVLSRLADEVLRAVLDAREPHRPAPVGDLLAEMPDPPPGEMQPPRGRYATDLGLIVARAGGDGLQVRIDGSDRVMGRREDGWFEFRANPLEPGSRPPPGLRALRLAALELDDRELLVARLRDQEFILGERVSRAPVPEVWRRRLGAYRVLNPDEVFPLEDLRLDMEDGVLRLSYRLPLLTPKPVRLHLRPLGADAAVVLGVGRSRGQTVRVERDAGGQEVLRYSGFRARAAGHGNAPANSVQSGHTGPPPPAEG